jgi:hypothetical protein
VGLIQWRNRHSISAKKNLAKPPIKRKSGPPGKSAKKNGNLRQEKLGKGGRDGLSITETFCRNPVGSQSHPVELASSRKRVLRAAVG